MEAQRAVQPSRLDGNTLLYATMADPVGQLRLPRVMEAVFRTLGHNAVWLPMHVPSGSLAPALGALRAVPNFQGATVSIPHKPALAAAMDRLSTRARAAGGANLVRRDPDGALHGDMVDGTGFLRGLASRGHAVRGATAWVVGAGGAGAAIVAALAEAGADRITLTDRDAGRALAVADRVRHHHPATRLEVARLEVAATPPERTDYAINATPLGLHPDDPLPFDPDRLGAGTVVCDIVMKPKDTALLATAARRGLPVHHGHHMLDAQIPLYLDFLGIAAADEAAVLAVARTMT